MNWIKKNPHLLALAVLALALVASSVLIYLNTRSFDQKFASAMTPVTPDTKVTPLDIKVITTAEENALSPKTWRGQGLFIPEQYVIDSATNMPKKNKDASFYKDSLTKADIPNAWFDKYHLKTDDPNVPFADSDKDGFTNEDEWRGTGSTPGANSTDPNDPKSHPPYYTKLFLKQFVNVPFRLRFQGFEGDNPKAPKPDDTFQINALDLRQPSQFLKIGDMVPGTKFKLQKYEYKEVKDPKTDADVDVSELTLLDTESNEPIVLIKGIIVRAPDTSGVFIYEWPQPPITFSVKRFGKFVLLPDKDKFYKLLDINEKGALIETPSGEKVTILPDPRIH
jgi:hypothetical protein